MASLKTIALVNASLKLSMGSDYMGKAPRKSLGKCKYLKHNVCSKRYNKVNPDCSKCVFWKEKN